MAGLLTGPGPGLLEESVIAGVTGNLFNGIDSEPLRTTQLRAQFRIPTGFPIELAGKTPGRSTILWCKDTKKDSFVGLRHWPSPQVRNSTRLARSWDIGIWCQHKSMPR